MQVFPLPCFLLRCATDRELPWAFPCLGVRYAMMYAEPMQFEYRGFVSLLLSIALSASVGGCLPYVGRKAKGKLYRREAMAVASLSWVLATPLGPCPIC